MKVQRFQDLMTQMRTVARGNAAAPPDAARPSVEPAEALFRLLTPENRSLLRTIRDQKPQSVVELAHLTKRAEPNLLRTLGKLEALGLLRMQTIGRRRVPRVTVRSLRVEIDPFTMADRIQARPAPR
jgi:predicted transcriptional regulator